MRLKLCILLSASIFFFSCSGNKIELDLRKVELHVYDCDPGMDSINEKIYRAQEENGVTCAFENDQYCVGEKAEITISNSTDKTIFLNATDDRPDFIFGMPEHPLLIAESPAAVANIMECETGERSVFIRFLSSKSCELNATVFVQLEIKPKEEKTFSVSFPSPGIYRLFFNTVTGKEESGAWGANSIIYSESVKVNE